MKVALIVIITKQLFAFADSAMLLFQVKQNRKLCMHMQQKKKQMAAIPAPLPLRQAYHVIPREVVLQQWIKD